MASSYKLESGTVQGEGDGRDGGERYELCVREIER